MIIMITCPKCGHDLIDTAICTYPAISRKECPNCGWYYEEQKERVLRVPFVENESHYATLDSFQNHSCIMCANNPRNGGSGICHCTLGQSQITC